MGRRRRRVTRFPKKRLPKHFTCPECGRRSVTVKIDKIPSSIRVRCGICGEIMLKKIGEKELKIDCFKCKRTIAKVSISNDIIKIVCGQCGAINFFEMTDNWMNLNCHCPPSKQSRFRITEERKTAIIRCASCGLQAHLDVRKADEEIDLYNRFFDDYHQGIRVKVGGEARV